MFTMAHTLFALQVPQYVLEDYIEMGKGAECNIICSQSRRLSAIGSADHVSKERSQAATDTVDWAAVALHQAAFLYYEYLTVPLVIRPGFGWSNNTLHVILILATVDAGLFANYFRQGLGYSPPVRTIPGFRFPVRELYLEDALELTGYKVGCNSHYATRKEATPTEDVSQSAGLVSQGISSLM
ncbi:unnamed protein product [Sphagnum troendelagicum]|uniref:Uncharacterized protein n=1 Tax=Sphagnum troendelagicum TaxID=128251 RepID=A0ABP0TE01_9BRYO